MSINESPTTLQPKATGEYYVYVLLDTTKLGRFEYGKLKFKYEPFYVGKGKGNRCRQHFSNWDVKFFNKTSKKNQKILEILNKNGVIDVVKLVENVSEEQAFKIEKEYIKLIGRINQHEGPLVNVAQGGGITQEEITKNALEAKFYCYVLLDPRKPGNYSNRYGKQRELHFTHEPFYVGKGTGNRAESHTWIKFKPTLKNTVIREIQAQGEKPIIHIVKSNLTELEALKLESEVITTIGRLDLETGPLLNLCDGGSKLPVGRQATEEQRIKQGIIAVRNWNSFSKEKQEAITKKRIKKGLETKANWTEEEREAHRLAQSIRTTKMLAAETPEQKKKRSKAYQETCARRTKEEQEALYQVLSTAKKRFFDSLSDKEYYEFHQDLTKKRNKTWKSLTEAERRAVLDNRSKGLKRYYEERSEYQAKQHSEAISLGLQSMSEKDKKTRNKNISKRQVKAYQENPDIVIQRTLSRQKTLDSWTKEQWREFGDKVQKGHANRTKEEKEKSRRKMSKSGRLRVSNETEEVRIKRSLALSKSHTKVWANYSKEERQARSEALVKAHARRSLKKKKQTSRKISNSVKAIHENRPQWEKDKISIKISLTQRTKHPSVSKKVARKAWFWYDTWDFSKEGSRGLILKLSRYLTKKTGRTCTFKQSTRK